MSLHRLEFQTPFQEEGYDPQPLEDLMDRNPGLTYASVWTVLGFHIHTYDSHGSKQVLSTKPARAGNHLDHYLDDDCHIM
jgi:hypothetical protein